MNTYKEVWQALRKAEEFNDADSAKRVKEELEGPTLFRRRHEHLRGFLHVNSSLAKRALFFKRLLPSVR